MSLSRRKFVQVAGATSAFALMTPGSALPIPFPVDDNIAGYRPELVPSAEEIWGWQVAMNRLGPNKYTGNGAHAAYVNYLEKNLKSLGLPVARDHYKLPLWEARNFGVTMKPTRGAAYKLPVSSPYPYSGQTGKEGVTGELVRMEYHPPASGGGRGQTPFQLPIDVKDKIVYVECPIVPQLGRTNPVWNRYTSDFEMQPEIKAVSVHGQNSAPPLDALKKAGALGLVLGWTNISDEQAAYQYSQYGHALADFPALWVGPTSAAKLKELCGTGAAATIVLEADVTPDTPTDTLYATLPGMTDDEIIIINTHTDGPNATEENGGIGIIAMAKYFTKLPKNERKRTMLFVLATGHFAGAYVPAIGGFIKQHPDLVQKTVAALTVEHLGCRDWLDDASGKYADSGQYDICYVTTNGEGVAKVMLQGVTGTPDRRVAIVKGPAGGEATALMNAGVPTMGYIVIPSYLFTGAPDGCLSKLDRNLLHGQVQGFVRVAHLMHVTSAADLKSDPWGNTTNS